MAVLTNALRLPQPLVDAVQSDGYARGHADISVTELLDPPRKTALERIHGEDIVEDAADRIWSLMGRIAHGILERADRSAIVEQRLTMEIEGWTVSGQFDRLALVEDGRACLQDYKVASVYEVKGGLKPEREQQLNCYAALCRAHGYRVDALQAVFILRDWSKLKARGQWDYPPHQVAVFDLPLWPQEQALAFLAERVRRHKQARARLPLCSPEEQWRRPEKWAVMRAGRKAALRLLDSEEAALAWGRERGYVTRDLAGSWRWRAGFSLEHRAAEAVRCLHYCAAAPFCEQFRKEQADVQQRPDQGPGRAA